MFEVIIIGAGPGGYLLAERIGKQKKTVIIEKDKFGGTCLNVGCIPSKTFLYSKKVFNYSKHAHDYGVITENVVLDQIKVVERKDKKVAQLVAGVEYKVKSNNVQIIKGEAKVVRKDVEGFHVEVNGQIIVGKKLVIATGSVSATPPIKGLKEQLIVKNPNILTNIEVLSLKELPKKLVIIGAGVIGLEMASYFEGLVDEITIVEFLPTIAGPTDLEISNSLLTYLKSKNINFKLSTSVTEVEKDFIIVKNSITNEEQKIVFDKLLVAAGRKPNTANMGFENIGLSFNRAAIEVDEKLQTNVPGVYCIGDANGKLMLAHTAYRHADVVYNQLMGNTYDYVDYNVIPSVIYTNPEIASVGKTEEQLKKDNIDYLVKKMPLLHSGRFLAEIDDYKGLIKMLVDKKTKQILGVHIFGQYATEIISIAILMITKKLSINLLKDVTMPHPTVAELLKDLIMLGEK